MIILKSTQLTAYRKIISCLILFLFIGLIIYPFVTQDYKSFAIIFPLYMSVVLILSILNHYFPQEKIILAKDLITIGNKKYYTSEISVVKITFDDYYGRLYIQWLHVNITGGNANKIEIWLNNRTKINRCFFISSKKEMRKLEQQCYTFEKNYPLDLAETN